jgi:GxxExxY protein
LRNSVPQLLHKVTQRIPKVSQRKRIMLENEISKIIIGCAIEVHKQLGPGLLESAYQECLFYELKQKGLKVDKEKPMPIVYKEVKLDHGYRIDLLVENKVVIEIKTVEKLHEVHTAQVLTYLKLGNYKLGLLLNFDVSLLKNGIKRIIN